jgi:CubicO group peptidase (beta-lactamase class C family)
MRMTVRRLPRTSPEAAGVDPGAIGRLFAALDEIQGVHSAMILRHGSVVAETWWAPHAPEHRHQMFSVSKAFTSMAVGIAVGEGLLSVEDRVVDPLPDAVPETVSDNLAAMRVEHLLTMTTGHDASSMQGIGRTLGRPELDWMRAILAVDVPLEPGSRFVYDTGATYLLSAILHRLTGRRLLDWLRPRLLDPLGITGATWEQDGQGIDVGGYGLSITTEDMAAFGQLLLQRGQWGDAQLIPADWIDRAMSPLVDSSPQSWDADWRQGYGYQLWRCDVDAARADGAFGQFIIVWPEHDAVIAITSGTSRTQAVLKAVWDALGDAFGEPTAQDGDALAPAHALATPHGAPTSPREADLRGRVRILSEPIQVEDAEIHGLSFERAGEELVLRAHDAAGELLGEARAAHDAWRANDAETLAASFAWPDERTLAVTIIALGTPFSWSGTSTFDGADAVALAWAQNVAFEGPTSWTATAHS